MTRPSSKVRRSPASTFSRMGCSLGSFMGMPERCCTQPLARASGCHGLFSIFSESWQLWIRAIATKKPMAWATCLGLPMSQSLIEIGWFNRTRIVAATETLHHVHIHRAGAPCGKFDFNRHGRSIDGIADLLHRSITHQGIKGKQVRRAISKVVINSIRRWSVGELRRASYRLLAISTGLCIAKSSGIQLVEARSIPKRIAPLLNAVLRSMRHII